jgi:nucleoside-diphosphate-sugar epimerase
VDVARRVLDACETANVGRVLFVSSISVYGHPKIKTGELISEDVPLGQHMWLWDYYAQAKILAEELAWKYRGDLTVVRPSWIYGPRDRVTIPRVVPALRARRVPIIGRGDNLLNLIYAGDVARGCILAANHPQAKAQAYNLSSRGELTQQQMVNTLTDALGLPRVERHVPFWLVKRLAFVQELFARMLRKQKPPTITRRAVYLIGRPARFSIDKARNQLAWEPKVDIQEGAKQTLEWYFAEENPKSENRNPKSERQS